MDILNKVYPDEFFLLQHQISMRKTDEYIMQLQIVSNPHKNPEDAKEFIDMLMGQRRFYRHENEVPVKLDVTAFENMRKQLGKESNLIKVK